jgi:hypothetical protein
VHDWGKQAHKHFPETSNLDYSMPPSVTKKKKFVNIDARIGVVGRKSLSLSRKLMAGTGNSLVVFIPRINR